MVPSHVVTTHTSDALRRPYDLAQLSQPPTDSYQPTKEKSRDNYDTTNLKTQRTRQPRRSKRDKRNKRNKRNDEKKDKRHERGEEPRKTENTNKNTNTVPWDHKLGKLAAQQIISCCDLSRITAVVLARHLLFSQLFFLNKDKPIKTNLSTAQSTKTRSFATASGPTERHSRKHGLDTVGTSGHRLTSLASYP
jgi:hypothetical protein